VARQTEHSTIGKKEKLVASKKLVFIDRFINPLGLEFLQNSQDIMDDGQATSMEPDAMWEALYNMSENSAKQWLNIFQAKRPSPIVNPEVWPAYVARHKAIIGQEPTG
jgi:hypothetical protein